MTAKKNANEPKNDKMQNKQSQITANINSAFPHSANFFSVFISIDTIDCYIFLEPQTNTRNHMPLIRF